VVRGPGLARRDGKTRGAADSYRRQRDRPPIRAGRPEQRENSISRQSQTPSALGGAVFPGAFEGRIGRSPKRLLGGIENGFGPTTLVAGLDGYDYKSFHDRLPSWGSTGDYCPTPEVRQFLPLLTTVESGTAHTTGDQDLVWSKEDGKWETQPSDIVYVNWLQPMLKRRLGFIVRYTFTRSKLVESTVILEYLDAYRNDRILLGLGWVPSLPVIVAINQQQILFWQLHWRTLGGVAVPRAGGTLSMRED
jgi:hypothetical protein